MTETDLFFFFFRSDSFSTLLDWRSVSRGRFSAINQDLCMPVHAVMPMYVSLWLMFIAGCMWMIGSKDYRREITILSSWRTRCSSRTCAGRRSIRLSQSCSLNTVKPQLRLDAETSSHSSYLDSVFQSVAFTLQRIGFDVTCIAACLALEKKKKEKRREKIQKVKEMWQLLANNVSPLFFFFNLEETFKITGVEMIEIFFFHWKLSITDRQSTNTAMWDKVEKQDRQSGQ